ncbi:MAG: choice-of-anchor J domain-containing protein [Bacteroidales bacterium]|nr:choice-of-anchor J domain-containing protein [Bacteroidales bacterium]
MKKLLTVLMMCFAVVAVNAQTFLLQESFESGIPAGWTTIDNDGDGMGWDADYWTALSDYGHTGPGVVASASYDNATYSALTPDNWLITPALNIPAAAAQPTLSLWARDRGYAEPLEILVSTTSATVAGFTAAPVFSQTISGDAYAQYTVDLSAYANQTIYIAFVHRNCTDNFWLLLDDIEVSYTPLTVAAAPANFTATPDANYDLNAVLSWTNPSVTVGGTALTSINSIELYRNNALVNSFANPTVGGAMTYTDNVTAAGVYNYRIYAVTAEGDGATATVNNVVIGNVCPFTLEMTDDYGDGWNGAAIEIYDANNTLFGSYTVPSLTQNEIIVLPAGSYTFVWTAGSYDEECSFILTDPFGFQLYNGGAPAAGTFLSYVNTCTPPAISTVSGTVTASSTNQPIAGATVAVTGLNNTRTVTTAANGTYTMDSIVSGFTYSFTVSAAGYNGASMNVANVTADTTINFALNAPVMNVTYAAPINVTTTQGLNAQFSPITVSNNGDGMLTWSTGVEYVRGRSAANQAAQYSFETAPRAKADVAPYNKHIANAQPVATGAEVCPTTAEIVGAPTRDAWDLLSSFTGTSAGQQGVATDGQYIYTCSWQGTPTGGYTFYKYDLQGNFIEGFDIAGATGLRDLTYDGTYFYAGASTSALYQMDFATHTLVSTINTGVSAIRHCSYDPQADGFWVGDWSNLYLVNRSGAIVVTGPAVENVYGSAYDGYSAGGPYIWLFTQAAGTTGSAVFAQYDIANNTLTNTTFDISTNQPALDASASAGGAFGTDALVGGKFVIMANTQQDPNLISVFEIADAGWLSAAPGSGTVAPSQSTDITLNFDGNNPIGDYQATLTINSSNPNVGQEVIPVSFHIIAPDCDAPTNLQATATDYTYNALTWDAPANNTDLVEYRLYKNGSTTEFATTTSTSYNDTVAPGNYCYIVKAYYLDGTTPCLSLPTDTVCVEMLHAPSITATPNTLSINGIAGIATAPAIATVVAYTLSDDITISTNAPFEVSVDGTTYGATATIQAADQIQTDLYVRVAATATAGTLNDVVTLTSGTITATINVTADLISCDPISQYPYVCNFDDDLQNACWTIRDDNNDGRTFTLGGNYEGAWYLYSTTNPADDWLISPEFVLNGNQHVSFEYFVDYNIYPEQFSVYILQGDDETVLVPTATYVNEDPETLTADLSAYTGNYRIAIHAESDADMDAFFINYFTVDNGSGIEDNEANSFRVFPNPATNMINVEAQGFEQYQLVNMLGQNVMSSNLVNGNAQINVSNLSNGVYFVRLINGNTVETVKVIKK